MSYEELRKEFEKFVEEHRKACKKTEELYNTLDKLEEDVKTIEQERDEARELARCYRDAWREAEHVHPGSADWGMDELPWEDSGARNNVFKWEHERTWEELCEETRVRDSGAIRDLRATIECKCTNDKSCSKPKKES